MSAPRSPSGEARPPWRLTAIIAAILTVRLCVAGALPLTEDEAYYRLWSMHPALGYFDHPPMISWWVRAGRALVGDTALGVRLLPCLAAAATSLIVFDLARLAGASSVTAGRAAIWYNATLLVAAGGFLAVPDAPAALFWSLTLWALMRADRGRRANEWWLAAGVAAGLATLSKYSALFLGPGVLCWLLWTPERRAHLRTAGPWIALVAAAALFSLNVAWNAGHNWESFARQFGRVAPGRFAPRFLVEFLITQALLLNPALTAFLLRPVWRRGVEPSQTGATISLFVISSLPFLAYLAIHSLHDRVQAHWPAPLYPAAALVAALGAGEGAWRGFRWAPPAVACAVIAAVALALGLPPVIDSRIPDIAMPLRGWPSFARSVEARRAALGAAWVGTSSYGLAAQLADEPGLAAPVLQISERARWRGLTRAPTADLGQPGLVIDLPRRLDAGRLRACFAFVRPLPLMPRGAAGERPKLYAAFLVAHPSRDVATYGCL